MTMEQIDSGEFISKTQRSIVVINHSQACYLPLESTTAKGFIGAILCVFGLVLLRSIFSIIAVRKTNANIMPDVFLLKVAAGVSISITFLGGLVTLLLYSDDSAQLYLAVAIIDLIIVITNTITLLRSTMALFKNR